ncbi:hypothetical protein ABZ922_43235 [Streptomyces shenzhenensis]|uniref:hypothetical protein n=1 Tax=Streptomyces shenzhenensis TaxID=943815 RepID=UPI003410BA34
MTGRASAEDQPTPVGITRICARCLRETTEAMLVEWIDTGSGPGIEVWTCPDHVKGYTPEAQGPHRPHTRPW